MSHISTYKGDDQLASFKNELKKDRFTLVVFSKTVKNAKITILNL